MIRNPACGRFYIVVVWIAGRIRQQEACGTEKVYYGGVGNSFVAVVEFGPRIKAKSIVTGGSSSDPSSKHFNDQSLMYSKGQFKDVLFYKERCAKECGEDVSSRGFVICNL